MERRARNRPSARVHPFSWALAVSCLALLPIASGAQVYSSYDKDLVAYDTARYEAVKTFRDLNLNSREIAECLPLLMDLRDAEREMRWQIVEVDDEMLIHSSQYQPKVSFETRIESAKSNYRNHRDSIWATISRRCGSSKAEALRGLCEPREVRETVQVSEGIQRIDKIIAEWDVLIQQRLARNTQTPENGTVVAASAVVTTTPPATTETITYYTSPPLSTADLCDMMKERYVMRAGGYHGWNSWTTPSFYLYRWDDLDNNAVSDLWQTRMGIWE